MNNLINRIFESWKSSLIGVGIITLCGAAILLDKVGLMEGFAGMTTALYFFFKKDGDKKSE